MVWNQVRKYLGETHSSLTRQSNMGQPLFPTRQIKFRFYEAAWKGLKKTGDLSVLDNRS